MPKHAPSEDRPNVTSAHALRLKRKKKHLEHKKQHQTAQDGSDKMKKRALDVSEKARELQSTSSTSTSTKPSKKPSTTPKETQPKIKSKVKSQSSPKPIAIAPAALTPLQSAMKSKLEAAQFRWLNERLYVLSSDDAWALLTAQPELFALYHRGFALQVKSWPLHPLDVIIAQLRAVTDRRLRIADLGCGEARLSLELSAQHDVHSFDLVAVNARVTAADIMSHVPLQDDAVDVAVFCLALMGTNLVHALAEARRILRQGGLLKVAEVASRFSPETMAAFLGALKALGFKLISRYAELKAKDYFVLLTFKLMDKSAAPPRPLPQLELKPCVYKKR